MTDELDLDDLPEAVRNHWLLEESAWVAVRDSGLEPLVDTPMITTLKDRAAFLIGAWLLDKTKTRDRRGLLANIKPQMLRVVDMLAAGRFKNAVILPRRSSKTTTLWCVLLGRCWLDEAHMAGYSMLTTQKKTAERYRLDVYGPITRKWPDKDDRPVKLYKGNGTERVEFDNGSVLAILSPDGDAFRSGAYETLVADEGGASSPEMGAEIKAAVLPAFDTTDGQFIVAGTAAKYRESNVLWDLVNDEKAGVIRFTVADTIDPEELEAWEPDEDHPRAHVRELVEGMHPGIHSGLTTLEKIEENWNGLDREQFFEEYLGLFGSEGSNTGLIPPAHWERSTLPGDPPPPPKRFTMAIAIHPDGLWASIGAAWHYDETDDDLVAAAMLLDGQVPDRKPRIGIGLLWHQHGVQGFATKALTLARKYKTPIIYDQLSQAAGVEVETLTRAAPRPDLTPAATSDVRRGATKVLKLLDPKDDTLRHWRSPQLDQAVTIAVKRAIGTAGGFGFGRPKGDFGADITPIEATSLALQFLGEANEKPAKAEIVFG
ncbi:hypothetical protein [Agromyces sp. CCNWLW203]|uniref:hypothetical protein n=1 Tax=Agromyces sp. CCNWLW203 TaxID=3112842 RepID=UPI002F96E05E